MKIEYKIDSLEGLDEHMAGMYVPIGDENENKGYILNVSGIPEETDQTSEIRKISSTMKQLREEKKQLKDKLNSVNHVDPEQQKEIEAALKTYQEKEAEYQRQKDEEAGNFKKLEEKLKEQHSQELSSYQQKIEEIQQSSQQTLQEMETSLTKNLLEREVTDALAKADGNIPILKPHVLQELSVGRTDDGEYQVMVKDSKGEQRFNDKGDPLTAYDLVNEFKERPEFQGDGIFKTKQKSGGSNSTHNKSTPKYSENPWSKDAFNLTKQGQIIRKDPDLAEKMKKEAAG